MYSKCRNNNADGRIGVAGPGGVQDVTNFLYKYLGFVIEFIGKCTFVLCRLHGSDLYPAGEVRFTAKLSRSTFSYVTSCLPLHSKVPA